MFISEKKERKTRHDNQSAQISSICSNRFFNANLLQLQFHKQPVSSLSPGPLFVESSAMAPHENLTILPGNTTLNKESAAGRQVPQLFGLEPHYEVVSLAMVI